MAADIRRRHPDRRRFPSARRAPRDTSTRPDWLTTVDVDLDGRDNEVFWRDYWDNGFMATALYYLPHLRAMPERAGAALSAIVGAPPGGVLFHCMAGRDRTGLVAMLLLAAVDTDPEQIVHDYLERCGWARSELRPPTETSTSQQSRLCAKGMDPRLRQRSGMQINGLLLGSLLDDTRVTEQDRMASTTWRGTLDPVQVT